MPLFVQITILLVTVLILLPVTKKIGLPIVTGYILVGIILSGISNILGHSFSLSYRLMDISILALMFFLGLHLRPAVLSHIPRKTIKFHLLSTLGLGALFGGLLWGFSSTSILASILLGFAFAFSALSLNLPIMQYQNSQNTSIDLFQHRFLSLQITFFALLLVLFPVFSGFNSPQHGIAYIAAITATCSGLFWFGQTQFKRFFNFLARYQSTELLTVFSLALFFATLALMQALNMPLALGALVCGILLADAPFRAELHQQLSIWKIVLIGLFFSSIALQLNFEILIDNITLISLAIAVLIILKTSVWFAQMLLQKQGRFQSLASSLAIAQSGECTLLIILLALTQQMINLEQAQILSWVVIGSLLVHPCLQYLLKLSTARKNQRSTSNTIPTPNTDTSEASSPIIIAGFGRFGQMIGRIAHLQNLPFIAIDNAIDELDFLTTYGGEFIAADITDPEHIQQLPLSQAQMFILAIDDVDDAMTIARYLHLHYPELPILARARDRHHAYLLQELGVHYIWRETWHSALDLAKHLLLLNAHTESSATQWLDAFKQYDERLIASKQGIYVDHQQVNQSTQNFAEELENLFENDLFVHQQSKSIKDNPSSE